MACIVAGGRPSGAAQQRVPATHVVLAAVRQDLAHRQHPHALVAHHPAARPASERAAPACSSCSPAVRRTQPPHPAWLPLAARARPTSPLRLPRLSGSRPPLRQPADLRNSACAFLAASRLTGFSYSEARGCRPPICSDMPSGSHTITMSALSFSLSCTACAGRGGAGRRGAGRGGRRGQQGGGTPAEGPSAPLARTAALRAHLDPELLVQQLARHPLAGGRAKLVRRGLGIAVAAKAEDRGGLDGRRRNRRNVPARKGRRGARGDPSSRQHERPARQAPIAAAQ